MYLSFSRFLLFIFLFFGFGYNSAWAGQKNIVSNSNFIIKDDFIKKKNQNIIKVNSIGIGKTLKEAKDDAAINAISKVVGTYFDGKKIIKRINNLNSNNKKAYREISKNYFTFNRGNIYYFEVTNTKNVNDIIYIDAIVEVSKERIEEYIDEYNLNESIIGLEIDTIRKSRDNYINQRAELLFNLFERKNFIDYQYISHGQGQLLENFSFFNYCRESLKEKKRVKFCDVFSEKFDIKKFCNFECVYSDQKTVLNELSKYNAIKKYERPYNILVLPFKIIMREDYINIYNNLFEEISINNMSFKYSNNSLIDLSKKTNQFISENIFKENSSDRLIIFNNNVESILKNYYVLSSPANTDIYKKLFSSIEYERPILTLTINDKFKDLKRSLFFHSTERLQSSNGLCPENSLNYQNKYIICDEFEVKDAKIISVLNDLPIAETKEISLLNSVKNEYFKLRPLVVNTEKNFLLFLNLDKFDLEKDDSITLEFQSLKDNKNPN